MSIQVHFCSQNNEDAEIDWKMGIEGDKILRGKVGKTTKIILFNEIQCYYIYIVEYMYNVCLFLMVTFLFLEGIKVAGMQISHRLIT